MPDNANCVLLHFRHLPPFSEGENHLSEALGYVAFAISRNQTWAFCTASEHTIHYLIASLKKLNDKIRFITTKWLESRRTSLQSWVRILPGHMLWEIFVSSCEGLPFGVLMRELCRDSNPWLLDEKNVPYLSATSSHFITESNLCKYQNYLFGNFKCGGFINCLSYEHSKDIQLSQENRFKVAIAQWSLNRAKCKIFSSKL